MKTKSKLAEKIQMLQASAAAVCHACPLRMTADCRGPACSDIIHIVNEIDPLVSEYFRLELAEKRTLKPKMAHQSVRQLCLPIYSTCELLAGADECAACDEQLYYRDQVDETNDGMVREAPPQYGYGLTQYALIWDDIGDALAPDLAHIKEETGQNSTRWISYQTKPKIDPPQAVPAKVKLLAVASQE